MTQTAADTRPPGLAAWLVELFASPEQAESILGDLSPRISGHRFGIRNRFCPPLALAPKPLNYGIPIVHIIASMFVGGIIALELPRAGKGSYTQAKGCLVDLMVMH